MTNRWARPLARDTWTRLRAHVGELWDRTLAPAIQDRRGGLAPFLAISIIPLVAFIGVGTDAARGYIVKSRLSYALDAAGLAASNVIDPANASADLQMYFSANFPPGYMNAALDGPHFTMDSTNQVMTLSATATIATTFTRVLGLETMTVSASSEVTRETQMMDVVLSMDLSGSMSETVSGETKISSARTAATTLVNILFGTNATNSLLHIGLLPWNGKVNVFTDGVAYNSASTTTEAVPSFANPVTGAVQSVVYKVNNSEIPLLSAPPSNWKGCVYARYVNDGNSSNDADLLEGLLSDVGGKTWIAWEPVLPNREPPSNGGTCSSCTPCLQYGIRTLTDTKETIQAAIDALQTPGGHTDLPQGLDMAWQVLTPTAPYTEADPNPPVPRKQAIVILTDGYNTQAQGDAYKNTRSASQLDARLRTLADNIKATGVKIYAIQFGDAPTAAQADLMKYVATEPNSPFYFYAPDGAALNAAFQQVANSLSQLRLSK
jgi:Mg-chelatase subunit ChlD